MKNPVHCLVPLLLLLAPAAFANLTVHPMRTAVDGHRSSPIRVYSHANEAQYIQVSLREIVKPASDSEHEIEVEPDKAAIAVTPGKFALAGGGNRLIRVIPLQSVLQETAYRLYFEAVRAPEDEAVEAVDGAHARLGVSLVWGALVNVLPAEGSVAARVFEGRLHNDGTLRLGITRIEDCDGSRCTSHDVSRSLYPGASLTLPFTSVPGHSVQIHYRLTRDGEREYVQSVAAYPSEPRVEAPLLTPIFSQQKATE